MKRQDALGKGLNALLTSTDGGVDRGEGKKYFMCSLDAITPNPDQPRKEMNGKDLESLSESIRQKGVIQPLVVREKSDATGYELIAGERRLRAARLAGLDKVPVVVREVAAGVDRLELAIIENIQRQNLNPIDEAEAYQRLVKEFGMTQEEVALKVGKDRSTVANILRILQLPAYVQDDVANGVLTLGHARVLLSMEDASSMNELRNQIVNQGLSVRQAEEIAKRARLKGKNAVVKAGKVQSQGIPESYSQTLTNDLTKYLGTKSKIIQQGGRGKIELEYYSLDDLERLVHLIIGS
ncbi:MAG: chromosome partitioning protein ParB [Deltaproteobacteria bacterium RIFOXYD12_FULL_50_9]|nr:MAG: chromosome partitioning protein ParB [Deltaproteobacteria bacterium RIFOXYD12_FULL_50_9]